MSLLRSAVLYTALILGANHVQADPAQIAGLRSGDMVKLVIHDTPRDIEQAGFTDPEGAEFTLADWRGKVVLVNFWATWCAPCRKEMPYLDALQREFGGPDFEVVTIATGRNALPAIRRFFDDIAVTGLPILLDPGQDVARAMTVTGLPLTVLLDREGREIARLIGDADWISDSARAIVAALIDAKG